MTDILGILLNGITFDIDEHKYELNTIEKVYINVQIIRLLHQGV